MRAFLRELVDLLAPRLCARCRRGLGEGDAGACAPCLDALPPWPDERCALCAEGRVAAPGRACAACVASGAPVEGVIAACAYGGELEGWIQRFKYPPSGLAGLDPAPHALLEAALRRALGRHAPGAPDLVVAVPQAPRRLRERGFNPAERLARAAARACGARCDPAALRRARDGPSQTGLDRAARRRNVAGAFRVGARAVIPPRVWLVDDVMTTGATLLEAARTLRRAGAREIVGVCVARTPFAR